MITIGRRHNGPRRDYQRVCDVCGVNWLRSKLRRVSDGFLVCPDDADGRWSKELDQANAQGVKSSHYPRQSRTVP